MISDIVLRHSEFQSDDDWVVIDALSQFALAAGERGYSSEDLPKEVLWNSQVTNAYGQINRNGPSLYFYNVLAEHDGSSRWDKLVGATRQGLRALGDVPQVAGFEKVMSAYSEHRDAIVAGKKSGDYFKLPNDFALLCEFMPSGEAEEEFARNRARWVRSLPNLKVVTDEDYEIALAKAFTAASR